jgi:hypothetical protein
MIRALGDLLMPSISQTPATKDQENLLIFSGYV